MTRLFFCLLVSSLCPVMTRAQSFSMDEAVAYALSNAIEVQDKNLQIISIL